MDRHRRRKRAARCSFFFLVTSLSVFFFGSGNHFLLSPFLYNKRRVFRRSAYAARHREPAKTPDEIAAKKKKHVHSSVTRSHFQFCRTGRSHASTPGAGMSAPAARPAGPDFDVARKRKRPRPFIVFSLPRPTLAIKISPPLVQSKERKGMERREENRCTTRLRLVGVCDRQRRGNKLVGAARASAILSTLASFLHVPCDGKAQEKIWVRKRKKKKEKAP